VEEEEVVPEHFLASLYGLVALALGAAVWSAMAVLVGPWALPVVPGLGWMVAWACRHGGRCSDTFVRSAAWVLALSGTLLALLALSVFSVTQASPDSGFDGRAMGLEYLRLFAEPPWFGSAAVLLTLAGARRALRDRRTSRVLHRPIRAAFRGAEDGRPGSSGGATRESGSRAA
jgi:hypothetical protein